VDKATTAGYLLPIVYFKKHGIKNYRTYFKETYFAGTHEGVIQDVLDGKADIGAAKNTVYRRMADLDGRVIRELAVLDRSPEVPENGLAVRGDLEESIKKKIREALLTMHLDPRGAEVLKKFGAQRFIETHDHDYLPVRQYARKANLNLATYDYRNE
jgi:phosphonate transport system substrate-binding protein